MIQDTYFGRDGANDFKDLEIIEYGKRRGCRFKIMFLNLFKNVIFLTVIDSTISKSLKSLMFFKKILNFFIFLTFQGFYL